MRRLAASLIVGEGGRSFTTKNFQNERYTGDPVNLVRILNELDADETEIISRASPSSTAPGLLAAISKQAFMPLTYFGGVRSAEDALYVARLGYEKIGVDGGAQDDPKLVEQMAEVLGASSTVLNITYVEQDGANLVVDWRKKTVLGKLAEWLTRVSLSPFGELRLANLSRDGTFLGPDLHVIEQAATKVNVPVTYAGGISSVGDVKSAWSAGAKCVSASSFISLRSKLLAPMILYPSIPFKERIS